MALDITAGRERFDVANKRIVVVGRFNPSGKDKYLFGSIGGIVGDAPCTAGAFFDTVQPKLGKKIEIRSYDGKLRNAPLLTAPIEILNEADSVKLTPSHPLFDDSLLNEASDKRGAERFQSIGLAAFRALASSLKCLWQYKSEQWTRAIFQVVYASAIRGQNATTTKTIKDLFHTRPLLTTLAINYVMAGEATIGKLDESLGAYIEGVYEEDGVSDATKAGLQSIRNTLSDVRRTFWDNADFAHLDDELVPQWINSTEIDFSPLKGFGRGLAKLIAEDPLKPDKTFRTLCRIYCGKVIALEEWLADDSLHSFLMLYLLGKFQRFDNRREIPTSAAKAYSDSQGAGKGTFSRKTSAEIWELITQQTDADARFGDNAAYQFWWNLARRELYKGMAPDSKYTKEEFVLYHLLDRFARLCPGASAAGYAVFASWRTQGREYSDAYFKATSFLDNHATATIEELKGELKGTRLEALPLADSADVASSFFVAFKEFRQEEFNKLFEPVADNLASEAAELIEAYRFVVTEQMAPTRAAALEIVPADAAIKYDYTEADEGAATGEAEAEAEAEAETDLAANIEFSDGFKDEFQDGYDAFVKDNPSGVTKQVSVAGSLLLLNKLPLKPGTVVEVYLNDARFGALKVMDSRRLQLSKECEGKADASKLVVRSGEIQAPLFADGGGWTAVPAAAKEPLEGESVATCELDLPEITEQNVAFWRRWLVSEADLRQSGETDSIGTVKVQPDGGIEATYQSNEKLEPGLSLEIVAASDAVLPAGNIEGLDRLGRESFQPLQTAGDDCGIAKAVTKVARTRQTLVHNSMEEWGADTLFPNCLAWVLAEHIYGTEGLPWGEPDLAQSYGLVADMVEAFSALDDTELAVGKRAPAPCYDNFNFRRYFPLSTHDEKAKDDLSDIFDYFWDRCESLSELRDFAHELKNIGALVSQCGDSGQVVIVNQKLSDHLKGLPSGGQDVIHDGFFWCDLPASTVYLSSQSERPSSDASGGETPTQREWRRIEDYVLDREVASMSPEVIPHIPTVFCREPAFASRFQLFTAEDFNSLPAHTLSGGVSEVLFAAMLAKSFDRLSLGTFERAVTSEQQPAFGVAYPATSPDSSVCGFLHDLWMAKPELAKPLVAAAIANWGIWSCAALGRTSCSAIPRNNLDREELWQRGLPLVFAGMEALGRESRTWGAKVNGQLWENVDKLSVFSDRWAVIVNGNAVGLDCAPLKIALE